MRADDALRAASLERGQAAAVWPVPGKVLRHGGVLVPKRVRLHLRRLLCRAHAPEVARVQIQVQACEPRVRGRELRPQLVGLAHPIPVFYKPFSAFITNAVQQFQRSDS